MELSPFLRTRKRWQDLGQDLVRSAMMYVMIPQTYLDIKNSRKEIKKEGCPKRRPSCAVLITFCQPNNL